LLPKTPKPRVDQLMNNLNSKISECVVPIKRWLK